MIGHLMMQESGHNMAKFRVIIDVVVSQHDGLLEAQWIINNFLKKAMLEGEIHDFDLINVDQVGE